MRCVSVSHKFFNSKCRYVTILGKELNRKSTHLYHQQPLTIHYWMEATIIYLTPNIFLISSAYLPFTLLNFSGLILALILFILTAISIKIYSLSPLHLYTLSYISPTYNASYYIYPRRSEHKQFHTFSNALDSV